MALNGSVSFVPGRRNRNNGVSTCLLTGPERIELITYLSISDY